MKKGSTLILKAAVVLMGLAVLALCIFGLPALWRGGPIEYPELAHALHLMVVGLYATAIPFFIASWQTMKLLNYIDKNTAFSPLSIKALEIIKYSAVAIWILYVSGLPFVYYIAQADDAPGLVVIGLVMASAPFVVAVFAAVLQRLLQNAIDMKSENELTV
jgi:hypothetical protein